MRKTKLMGSMLLGAAGMLGTLVSPAPADAMTHDADKHEITVGTDGRTDINFAGAPNSGRDHGTRIYCATSHLSYDDPVVYPGEPGAAHLHTFWGNTETNHASTGESLLAEGKSSCDGGLNNRSGYWAPTLFNENDEAVLPYDIVVYYKSIPITGQAFDRDTIQPIPNGLKMLANQDVKNSESTDFRSDPHVDDRYPSGMRLKVNFPQCLAVDANGDPVLESPDNTSHLAYQDAADGNSNHCPDSHPYRIPRAEYNMYYNVDLNSDWYLSSDTSADTQGESLHADYIVAWDEDAMDDVVECNVLEIEKCRFGGVDVLPERQYDADGNHLYLYDRLRTDTDHTPFGTELKKHIHVDPPTAEVFEVKAMSADPGSGWVVYTSGPNEGERQWIDEACRAELTDAGVTEKIISDYQSEIGSLNSPTTWRTCDQLLAL